LLVCGLLVDDQVFELNQPYNVFLPSSINFVDREKYPSVNSRGLTKNEAQLESSLFGMEKCSKLMARQPFRKLYIYDVLFFIVFKDL
jgi:hypothetical protein